MESFKPHFTHFVSFILVIIIAVLIGSFFLSTPKGSEIKTNTMNNSQSQTAKAYSVKPPMGIDQKKKYTAKMTTSKGVITINLFASETPETVNNFVFLSRDKFYDGTLFHRIIKDFMIQGGDPKGDGTGGPGYKFNDEKITRDYKRGVIAMANSGPNTNGSQFFIMHKDVSLPKNYVIFGEVTDGMDALDALANTPVEESAMGEMSKPKEKVTVENVEIIEES